jgi:hypothetical protein
MIEAYVLAAVALVLLGAGAGFIAVITLAMHQDKDITVPTPDRLARGARVTNGVHTRGHGVLHKAAYRHNLPQQTDQEW